MLRAARPGDHPTLVAALSQAGLPVADLQPDDMPAFLIVTEGDAWIGCVGLQRHENDGLLRSLLVQAAHRQAGLGAALVDAAEAEAHRASLRSLYLLTDTAADWFARRGYARLERARAPAAIRQSAEFSALCPSTSTCMVKRLDAPASARPSTH